MSGFIHGMASMIQRIRKHFNPSVYAAWLTELCKVQLVERVQMISHRDSLIR